VPETAKIAIIAALEREVRLLVRHWRPVEREYEGGSFKFFESGRAVLVCGGIGAEAARRATEAVIAFYAPKLVHSVGFAGALDQALKVGDIFSPSRVVDAKDGSRLETGTGRGILVTVAAVASAEQKRKLAENYGAQAVDMEAAAVARGAQTHGIEFKATKAISDEVSFEMPSLDYSVDSRGRFRTGRFAVFALLRPWLWGRVIHLARNSVKASQALCAELTKSIDEIEKLDILVTDSHQNSIRQ
jgi:adenosylhomocysteine nucleosidase